jgi:hypothetical protein
MFFKYFRIKELSILVLEIFQNQRIINYSSLKKIQNQRIVSSTCFRNLKEFEVFIKELVVFVIELTKNWQFFGWVFYF